MMQLISITLGEHREGVLSPPSEDPDDAPPPPSDRTVPMPTGARMLGVVAVGDESRQRYGLELLGDRAAAPVRVRVVVLWGGGEAKDVTGLTYAGGVTVGRYRGHVFYDADALACGSGIGVVAAPAPDPTSPGLIGHVTVIETQTVPFPVARPEALGALAAHLRAVRKALGLTTDPRAALDPAETVEAIRLLQARDRRLLEVEGIVHADVPCADAVAKLRALFRPEV